MAAGGVLLPLPLVQLLVTQIAMAPKVASIIIIIIIIVI